MADDGIVVVRKGDHDAVCHDEDHRRGRRFSEATGWLLAGETKVVAFEVVELQSPPHLTTKLKIQHKGKVTNSQIDVPGHRKGKDKEPKQADNR